MKKRKTEKGKKKGVELPREQRICQICEMNLVEDESHFLVECEAYKNRRINMEKDIQPYLNKDKLDWSKMNNKQKLFWLIGDDELKGRAIKRDLIKVYLADIYQWRHRLVETKESKSKIEISNRSKSNCSSLFEKTKKGIKD